MMAQRRATFLVNPDARGVAKRLDPERAVRYLRKRGLAVVLDTPASSVEMTRAAAAAAERADDLVFVAGGDGSMRDAAAGLAGSTTALAPVPAGTVNVFAREAGLPPGIRTAIDAHLEGRVVRMDLGRANGRPFLLMASAGWDARIVRDVSLGLKRRIGDLAYGVRAAFELPRLAAAPAGWQVDGERHEGSLALMVVSNTRLYGGRVQFTPLALADDGRLDVVALCPDGPLDLARMSARLLTRRIAGDRRALSARAAEVVLETPGIPLQLDGDYAGESPARFTVDPGDLAVSIPAGARPQILSG
jgi:YegS/Rv2252/BmrU family lipid kinase